MDHIDYTEKIAKLLRDFEAENEDIKGTYVQTIQGLPICSSLGSKSNENMVAAMAAAILSVGERAAQELARGKLKRILLDGEEGLIILQQSGINTILCVLVENDRQLGLIFILMKSIAQKIANILE